jgi:hypothetical protein
MFVGRARGPRNHDGAIIPDSINTMWGTDMTTTWTRERQVAVFIAVDHHNAECVGIHADRRGRDYDVEGLVGPAPVNPDIVGDTGRHFDGEVRNRTLAQEVLRVLGNEAASLFDLGVLAHGGAHCPGLIDVVVRHFLPAAQQLKGSERRCSRNNDDLTTDRISERRRNLCPPCVLHHDRERHPHSGCKTASGLNGDGGSPPDPGRMYDTADGLR